jgi:hypothetical protein
MASILIVGICNPDPKQLWNSIMTSQPMLRKQSLQSIIIPSILAGVSEAHRSVQPDQMTKRQQSSVLPSFVLKDDGLLNLALLSIQLERLNVAFARRMNFDGTLQIHVNIPVREASRLACISISVGHWQISGQRQWHTTPTSVNYSVEITRPGS